MKILTAPLGRVRGNKAALVALSASSALVVLGLAFWAGLAVGAGAARRPAQPPGFLFGRPFGGPRGQMGHGAFGSITSIDGDSITITDSRFGQPRTIAVSRSTLIERGNHQRVQVRDLKLGDNLTVIGSPMKGNIIEASYIGVGQGSPLNFEWRRAPPRFLDAD